MLMRRKNIMRVALYIRVSDEEQVKEGYSIESQTAVCSRWAADKGHDVVETYVDEGVSSKTLKRPAMQRMIRDIERRKFDLLIFWRLNRLTRTVKDKEFLFDHFEKYDVSLKSMTEEIDTTTASGRMITNLLVSVAQGEREQTAENVHSTMMELHLSGKRQGAIAPYGYDLIDGKLVINEDHAVIIRKIFKMYDSNQAGFREIAVTINRDPDKPDDRLWDYSSIRYVLMNPAYCGDIRWNNRKLSGKTTGKEVIVTDTHPAIVNREMFKRINDEIKNRKVGGKTATSEYAFGGVLKCGRCGSAMVGFSAKKSNGQHRYYRCRKRAAQNMCDMPILKDFKVEEAFLAALDYDPKQLKKFMNVNISKSANDKQKRVAQLQKRLEAVQKRKKKWRMAYAAEVITLEELKEHTQEDNAEEELIQQELNTMPESTNSRWTKDEVLEQLYQVRELWKKSGNEKVKKAFVRDVFERITVNTETERGQGAPGSVIDCMVTDFKLRI
jgi:site-specific DNA recombinase